MYQQRGTKLLYTLTTAGHKPNLHIMDNEAGELLKQTLLQKKISYQLVPMHTNLHNSVEGSIQTLKTTLLQVSDQLIPNIQPKNGNPYSHRPL